jgi:hypothetical protein
MNTGTLVASLILAAVIVVAIGLLIRAMMRGWRGRAERQIELIGKLPPLPDTVSQAIIPPMKGLYVGCTLAPNWHDRIVVGDLGYRTKAVLTRFPEGIMVQRSGAHSIWIPAESVLAIRTERGMVGKVVPGGRSAATGGKTPPHEGILAIRWRLPSGTEIDTGFRGDDRTEYDRWLEEEA